MPIAALPQDTARAITSTLALSDAASVIKELVDNALDSRADTISVEVAANTLNVIQVKDNGSGIGVEDRLLLCKRGCTSKIRSIEDLASLGGTFLGFRGEALASVAELSSAVTITTRIEGEVVGTALKFGPDGKLLSSSSASHPVGTTVRIQDFLSKIPVRKQTALKATTKTIAAVRKLLQAYAFARSEVRLSFKVLKAKNEKSNWAFAPGKLADRLSEVATKIVGKDVTDQCIQEHANSADGETGKVWQLDALVISPTSDIRKACNSDQYLSVDRRPVSAERGVMKELSKTYKQFLRNSLAAEESPLALTKPFLLVRITCPSDSYDVNIEPAKDEVLFYNPTLLRSLFTQVMEKRYGPFDKENAAKSPHRTPVKPNTSAASSFDVLLARRPDAAKQTRDEDLDQESQKLSDTCSDGSLADGTPSNPVTEFRPNTSGTGGTDSVQARPQVPDGHGRMHVNMYTVDDNEVLATNDSESIDEHPGEEGEDAHAVDVRNPWSLAKLNVRLAPRNVSSTDATDFSVPASASTIRGSSLSSSNRIPLGQGARSPTIPDEEMVPFQNPGPPLRPWGPGTTRRDTASLSPPGSDVDRRPRASMPSGAWINGQLRPSQQPQPLQDDSHSEGQTFVHHSQSFARKQGPLRSPTKASSGSGRGDLQQQRLSLPFKTPFRQAHSMQDAVLTPPQSNRAGVRNGTGSFDHPRVAVRPQQVSGTPLSASQIELDEILEFERRKKVVAAQQRKQLAAQGNWNRASTLPSSSSQAPTTSPNSAQMYDRAFPNAFSRSTGPSESGEPAEDFESRFAKGDPSQELQGQQSQPARSNPHHNRYIAAARNLSQPRPAAQMLDHAHPEPPSPPTRRRRSYDDPDGAADATPKIPESDPRAYLIRFRQQQASQDQPAANGLTRTGLKIRRAKTTRLPLESVPVDANLHDLAVELQLPHKVNETKSTLAALVKVDEYVKSGRVDAAVWSPLSKEVSEWENVIKRLVQKRYRPSVLEDSSGDDGEKSDPCAKDLHFEINLSQVLKAFVDGDGI